MSDIIDRLRGPAPSIPAMREGADEIARLRSAVEALERQVFVPGLWRCAKCSFQLVQSSLNANDGSVRAADKPGEKCPNCNVPLWRVTEREAGTEAVKRAMAEIESANAMSRVIAECRSALKAQVFSTRLFGRRAGFTDDEISTAQAQLAMDNAAKIALPEHLEIEWGLP